MSAAPAAQVEVAPRSLRAAAALVVGQTAGEAVGIGLRHELRWPLRIALIAIIAFQLACARGLLHLSPAAVFAVFAYQLAAVLAAIGMHAGAPIRLLFAASAVLVVVLVARSLHAFPEPDLPLTPRGRR